MAWFPVDESPVDEAAMNVQVNIHEGPLAAPAPWRPQGAGAVVAFEGVVRPWEAGGELAALRYEVYEPMTRRELHKLAERVVEAHDLTALHVEHSRGDVPVGEVSFRLHVAAAHRKEALVAMEAFIDRMKRDVPIWKVPLWKAAVPKAAVPASPTAHDAPAAQRRKERI